MVKPPVAIIQALLAAVLFGASVPLAKGIVGGADPQVLAGLLYAGAGLGLGVLRLALGSDRAAVEAPLARGDIPWLAGAILLGGVLGPVLLLMGLARTPASEASLLLNLEALFTALVAWTAFREHVSPRVALGMLAIVAGGVALSWSGKAEAGRLAGPLLVGTACLCWALDNNLTRKVSGGDPIQVALVKGCVAGAVNLGIGLARTDAWPAPSTAAAALALGFVGYGLSLVLYVLALRDLGTARAGAYFSAAPFVGAALGLALWRDPVTPLFLVGAAAMAAGLWAHLTERHEHLHEHEPLLHSHRHVHDEHHRHAHVPGDPPGEPHTHVHVHERLVHSHPHFPDLHHRHRHG
jgi:drug/metabolite transporter (DMT)-like permease